MRIPPNSKGGMRVYSAYASKVWFIWFLDGDMRKLTAVGLLLTFYANP